MKNVLIINASGFGREVCWLVQNAPQYGIEFKLKGFLDNRKDILQKYNYSLPILGAVEDYDIAPDDVFVCAISNPHDKHKYATMIKARGGSFINIIDRSVLFSTHITLGEGIIIANSCALSCDVTIGDFVTMNAFSVIGHDVAIENFVHINSFCAVNGGTTLREFSTLHSHAVILPGNKVGRSAVVGAGSVVLKDVPDNETVFGVPAMRVRA